MSATPERPLVVIVDDETSVLDSIAVLVTRKLDYRPRTFETPADAIEAIQHARPAVVVTDLFMDGRDAGLDVLTRTRELWPDVPVILMSAVASKQAAIQALNAGAFHLIEKPFRNDTLAHLIRTAVETASTRDRARDAVRLGKHARSRRHNHPGSRTADRAPGAGQLIGESEPFLETLALVEQAADTDVTVLLTGESGTGKGVLASHLHQSSPRRAGAFLSVNCGALTETLLESQLFGHVRGAFTGADRSNPGLVRAASGGTLFLDEVAELSPATQVKLLRVLQEREVIPVGGTDAHAVDVRFVAATNKDLRREVALGRFREDLYWRLNVMAIRVPPLRERSGDAVLLARAALERIAARDPAIRAREFSEAALERIRAHPWPGNVRELENAVERAAVVAGSVIGLSDLPADVRLVDTADDRSTILPRVLGATLPTLAVVERAYVEWVLNRAGGDVATAAKALDVPPAAVRIVLAENGFERSGTESGPTP